MISTSSSGVLLFFSLSLSFCGGGAMISINSCCYKRILFILKQNSSARRTMNPKVGYMGVCVIVLSMQHLLRFLCF